MNLKFPVVPIDANRPPRSVPEVRIPTLPQPNYSKQVDDLKKSVDRDFKILKDAT